MDAVNHTDAHDGAGREGGRQLREVGRCYTRARRLPLMIGRLPGSDTALWGGPYTVTQVVVACSTAVVLWWSRDLWAMFGVGWNGAILLGIPITAALLVRRARIEGRDPLRVGLGIASAVTAPTRGRTITGTPWGSNRRLRLPASPVHITNPTPTTGGNVSEEALSPGEAVSRDEVQRLSWLRARGLDQLDEAEVDELLRTALRLYRQEHGQHRRDSANDRDGGGIGGGAR